VYYLVIVLCFYFDVWGVFLKVLFKLCYVVGEIYAIVIEQTIGSLRHYLCGFMRWTRLFLMFVYG